MALNQVNLFIVHPGKVGDKQVYNDTSSWENMFLVSVIIFYLSFFPCSHWTTSTICLCLSLLSNVFENGTTYQ